jgi:hypothetical protein
MPKPYNLRVRSSVLDASGPKFQMDLTRYNTGWRRSTRAQGGYWQGSFRLTGQSEQKLQNWFETWLGYDVLETSGGAASWQGMIYEMDLMIAGVRRRRSLDLMSNAIKTTYTGLSFSGDNMVINAGFDYLANINVFTHWYDESQAPGQVIQIGGGVTGNACQIRGSNLPEDTFVRQNVNVTPGARYRLTFWTRSHDNAPGRFRVRDPNAAEDIISLRSTGYSGPNWTQIGATGQNTFIGPAGGEILLFFYSPYLRNNDGDNVYFALDTDFDDVELCEELPSIFETEWAVNQSSIDRYGRKELVVHLDEYGQTTSEEYRDKVLAVSCWPWPRPVGAQPPGQAVLDVVCCGYIFTTNWMQVMGGDGQNHNVSDWIATIIGSDYGLSPNHGGTINTAGDCQFIKTVRIDENTLQVPAALNMEQRPFDVLSEMVELGDDAGHPWQLQVLAGRKAIYQQIPTTPSYYLRRDGIYDTAGGAKQSNFWLMKPGVFRDMTWRSGSAEIGSWLENRMDFFVDEIEMADGWSRPALKTALLDESEILKAQMEVSLLEPPPDEPLFPPVVPPTPPGDDWRPPHP